MLMRSTNLGCVNWTRIHTEMRVIFDELGYPAAASVAENLGRGSADSGFVPASEVVGRYEAIVDEGIHETTRSIWSTAETELVIIGGERGGFYVRPAIDGLTSRRFLCCKQPR